MLKGAEVECVSEKCVRWEETGSTIQQHGKGRPYQAGMNQRR